MPANQTILIALAMYLTIIIGIIVLGGTIIGSIAFFKTRGGAARTFSLLMQRASALQMLAVVMIILSSVALRILELIEAQAIVSILSGIAGYVLAGVSRVKAYPSPSGRINILYVMGFAARPIARSARKAA